MNNKTWQKLEIECAQPLSETIAAHFTDLTGSGVEIRDNETGLNETATLVAYLDSKSPSLVDILASARNYLQKIASLFPEYPPPSLRQDPIANEDWGRKWKERFKPFKLTERFVIKPSWENYSPEGDEKVIEIDPGMAFGTGLHASTMLAAMLIEEHIVKLPSPPEKTLDIGTGTGILAMCCSNLGCDNITAIDNDPEAVTAALENISMNNMDNRIKAEITPLGSVNDLFDLVIANIIHNTLVEMAPAIDRVLANSGILIMAGILAGDQAQNITRVYEELGIHTVSQKVSGEWAALLLRKSITEQDDYIR